MMVPSPISSPVTGDREAWRAFRRHSRTFSFAAHLLPYSVRQPAATLYLFCRSVDTIADRRILEIGPELALSEVLALQSQLVATLDGSPPDGYLWHRLYAMHRTFCLPRAPLLELIDGAIWDLKGRIVETEADLLFYSNLVGGSVGAMMLPLLVKEPSEAVLLEQPARALGTAMQLTNIVRDVGEDLRLLNRIYLPRTWLEEEGLNPSLLLEEQAEGYPKILERVMRLAERYYEEGFQGIPRLPQQVRPGILAAARIYREILNEVRKQKYDNLQQRAFVPGWRKCLLVVGDGYDRRKEWIVSPFL